MADAEETQMSQYPVTFEATAGLGQAAADRFRYVSAIVLLATYFYTIPVIKTGLGYTTYIKLDDIASLVFILSSLSAILHRARLGETRLFQLMLLALLLAVPSVIWGFLMGATLKNALYGLWQTSQYAKAFLVFAAAAVLTVDERRFRQLMVIAWMGTVFVAVYGTLQEYGVISLAGLAEQFSEGGPWAMGGGITIYNLENIALGPLSHNYMCIGNYLVIGVFLAILLARTGRFAKVPLILSTLFFLVVIFWSTSRAAFLGLFFGLLVYLIQSKARPAAIFSMVLAGGLAAGMFLVVPSLQQRFLGTGETLNQFTSGRTEGLIAEARFLLTHPHYMVAGVGLGNFSEYADRIGLAAGHNNYMHWWIESGLLGLLLPTMFVLAFRRMHKELLGVSPFHREVSIVFWSLLITLLGIALSQETFVPSPAAGSLPAYVAFLMGLMVSLHRNASVQEMASLAYGDGPVGDETAHPGG
jgi:hypothetical protein